MDFSIPAGLLFAGLLVETVDKSLALVVTAAGALMLGGLLRSGKTGRKKYR